MIPIPPVTGSSEGMWVLQAATYAPRPACFAVTCGLLCGCSGLLYRVVDVGCAGPAGGPQLASC